MSDKSNIEWTDATWNPVRGCVKISPGCANCYAETFAERFRGVSGHPYEQGFDLRLVPEKLMEPLSWKKPRRVFVNSMSDLFQDGVPDSFIDQVFAMMALCPQHTFQVLTKRAERMRRYADQPVDVQQLEIDAGFRPSDPVPWPLPNVWLGVSVENQHFANERIPLLLQTPAAVRFISAEPLLEAVDLTSIRIPCAEGKNGPIYGSMSSLHALEGQRPKLDWVIVGGESGPAARPCDVAWARSIVQQCQAASVPCFVKQLGSRPLVPACRQSHFDYGRFITRPESNRFSEHDSTRWRMHTVSKKGGDTSEWPESLRVREFPSVRV